MKSQPVSTPIFDDVCNHAVDECLGVASRIIGAALPPEVYCAALLRVAFEMTHAAAALYTGIRGPNGGPVLGTPEAAAYMRAIARAWTHAPDQAAMTKALVEEMSKASGEPFETLS